MQATFFSFFMKIVFENNLVVSSLFSIFALPDPTKPLHDAQFHQSSVLNEEFAVAF